MASIHGLDRPENASFAAAAQLFKDIGCRVPEVKAYHPGDRWVLQEDLGDDSLYDRVRQGPLEESVCFYEQVIRSIALLHSQGAQRAESIAFLPQPAFNLDLYQWEHAYFMDQLGKRFLGQDWRKEPLQRELDQLSSSMLSQPLVLVHRDLQSQNVQIHRGKAVLIDLQGTRLGPAIYDLVSLLEDPYVDLPEELKDRLLRQYDHIRACPPRWSTTSRVYLAASCQRLMQALGAYAFLSLERNRMEYQQHIPKALLRLRQRAHRLGFPHLGQIADTALDLNYSCTGSPSQI